MDGTREPREKMPDESDEMGVKNVESRDQGVVKDGGWAWVICGALFFMLLLSLGYVRIFGILFVAFQSEFSSSASATASIMGVYAVVYSITSLLACNVFLERFSARQITLVGGIIVAVGVAMDVFANSIPYLMCINGIVVGIGNAMIFGPGIVILGDYFERRRTLATAISFCGASVGGIILPPLVRYILDEYGVRGAMLIFGGVLLHIVPAALLLVPQKRSNISIEIEEQKLISEKTDTVDAENVNGLGKIGSLSVARDRQLNRFSCSLCEIPPMIPINREAENRESNCDIYDKLTTSLFKSLPSDLNTCHEDFKKSENRSRFVDDKEKSNFNDSASTLITETNKTHVLSRIRSVLDTSLFKSSLFCGFIGFHLFGYAGIVTFPTFVPPIAKENGLTDVQGALLVSLHAGLDLFCRIFTGLIADLGWFERYKMLAAAFLILGTVYQFVRYYTSFPLMILYVLMFGMFSGCFYSLHPSIAVDFFGKEKFAKVFGYVQFFHGVVITASYPIIGGLRDFTGTYAASCHFLGASLYVAAVLLLIKPLLENKNAKRSAIDLPLNT